MTNNKKTEETQISMNLDGVEIKEIKSQETKTKNEKKIKELENRISLLERKIFILQKSLTK